MLWKCERLGAKIWPFFFVQDNSLSPTTQLLRILCVSMSVFRWYLCILWCILLSLFVYWIYSWRVFVQQDLKRLSFIYLQLLKTKPLLTKSVTSLFLFFSSDFFAQCMTERTMSWKRMCRFALWGIYDIFDSAYMWNNLALFSPWLSR